MKTKLFLLIALIATSYRSIGQYISDPLVDTNLYQIEAKVNSLFIESDSDEDGPRT